MSKLPTINIKGKEYVQVNERINEFWINPKYEGLNFKTVKTKDEFIDRIDYSTGETIKTRVVEFRCVVFNSDKTIKVTGTAEEYENSSFINKSSFKENCETSAIGRALGNLGIGIDTSIASAEEVSNAISNQKKDDRPWLKETELKLLLNKGTKKQSEKVLADYQMKTEYKNQITSKFKI
jgi:hypothetical protein